MTDLEMAADDMARAAQELIWALRSDSSFQISNLNLQYISQLRAKIDGYARQRATSLEAS